MSLEHGLTTVLKKRESLPVSDDSEFHNPRKKKLFDRMKMKQIERICQIKTGKTSF